MLKKREVILAGIETTYNTDPTLTPSANAILVENPSWANEGLRMNERPATRPNLGTLRHVYGGRLVTISFNVEIKGSGTAGTAPEIGPLLRACGLGETVVSSTSVTYAPVSTGHESITIYYYRDGKRFIVTGCRGNATFSMEVGGIAKISFTFTGHVAADADVAMPTPTYSSIVPAPFVGGSFSIGGYSAVIGALSFDLGNTVTTPPDLNANDGYAEIRITGRDVNGSIDPEEVLVATRNFINDFTSGSVMSLQTGVIGGTAGNRFSITQPAVSYRDVSPGDRDGISILEMSYGAAENSGDDEVSLQFT